MNDFDSVLELRLKHLLDPVVASQPPARQSRKARRLILTVIESTRLELAPEAMPVVEPVVVTAQITAVR